MRLRGARLKWVMCRGYVVLLLTSALLVGSLLIACGSQDKDAPKFHAARSYNLHDQVRVDEAVKANNEAIGLDSELAVTYNNIPWTYNGMKRYYLANVGFRKMVIDSNGTNDVEILHSSAPSPDLLIESITWLPASSSKGDIVTFSVTIRNQGSGKAISSRVYFYVDGSFKGSQNVESIAVGELVTKTFTWTAEAGSHAITAIIDEENWIQESNENNNERTVTFLTVPPDLIVEAITWSPANPSVGDNITFTVKIKNLGSGKAAHSLVYFYVNNNRLASASVNTIDPGAVESSTFSWIAEAGSNIIKAIVDPYNRVLESDENNNEKMLTFPAISPDLIVQTITWSPVNQSVGETVTFYVTIKNQGRAVANSCSFHFYVGGSSSGSQNVESIAIGKLVTKTFTWTAKQGSHIVKVVVDPYNRVLESDESNNEKNVTFSGTLAADLIIQSITWSSVNQSVGETATFIVTIKNQGSNKADDSNVDYYIDDAYLTSGYVSPIDPGDTDNNTFTWTVQAGSHTLKAVADSKKEIPESNEDNNEGIIIYPHPPDLTIQAITWSPKYPSEGGNVTLVVTVKNQGSNKANYSNVDYYIDDVYLTSGRVSPIDPGDTDNITATWTAKIGLHTVKAVVDEENWIQESNEDNNEKMEYFPIFLSSELEPAAATDKNAQQSLAEVGELSHLTKKENGPNLLLFVLPLVGVICTLILFMLFYRRRHA